MDKFLVWVGVIAIVLIGWAVGFLFFSGLVWLVCWSFEYPFSWKYAFGIWIVWVMVSQLFKVTVKQEKTWK